MSLRNVDLRLSADRCIYIAPPANGAPFELECLGHDLDGSVGAAPAVAEVATRAKFESLLWGSETIDQRMVTVGPCRVSYLLDAVIGPADGDSLVVADAEDGTGSAVAVFRGDALVARLCRVSVRAIATLRRLGQGRELSMREDPEVARLLAGPHARGPFRRPLMLSLRRMCAPMGQVMRTVELKSFGGLHSWKMRLPPVCEVIDCEDVSVGLLCSLLEE